MKTVSIIIPCYNEEKSLPIYFSKIDNYLKEITEYSFDFILVNDGSKDKTLEVMDEIYNKRDDVNIISFSRNFGQNPAFIAGLEKSKSDYVILMDADLQDPLSLISQITSKFSFGYEVVNPYRLNRNKDSFFKRTTASMFYKLINKIEGNKVVEENVNCFRGLSRRVVDKIISLPEKDKFLLNEIYFVGFKTCQIEFTREKREQGESKYNVKRMTKYALDNISSGTIHPLYWSIKTGTFSLIFSALFFITMLVLYILSYPTINIIDNFSLMNTLFIISIVIICFSILLFFIGILGLYLHNVVVNTRNRPTYIIDFYKDKEDK